MWVAALISMLAKGHVRWENLVASKVHQRGNGLTAQFFEWQEVTWHCCQRESCVHG